MPTDPNPGPTKARIIGATKAELTELGGGPYRRDFDREDLLNGKTYHGEPNYKAAEVYMIGRPWSSEFRFPVFDLMGYEMPMEYAVARTLLESVLADSSQLGELPSLRYRLYRVSIEEV